MADITTSNVKTIDELDVKSTPTLADKLLMWDAANAKHVGVYPNNFIGKSGVAGRRLRNANLKDIFGTTDVQTVIAYASAQRDAICIGDYLDLPAFSFVDDVTSNTVSVTTTGNNSRIRIAANPSTYKGSGDTANSDGILWEFQNCPFLRGMNATNTNAGSYVGSEVHTVLNGAFATALQSVIGSGNVIQSTRRFLPTTGIDDYGSWAWAGEKCFLLTETEVSGFKNVGAKKFQAGNMFQLPIYALDPSARIKYFNGSRNYWWLGTAYTIDSNNGWDSLQFSDVSSGGYMTWGNSSASFGISPALVI